MNKRRKKWLETWGNKLKRSSDTRGKERDSSSGDEDLVLIIPSKNKKGGGLGSASLENMNLNAVNFV